MWLQVTKNWLFMVLIMVAVSLVTTPAAAFKLTVANQFDKQKSIALLYFDESVEKWLCVGWYTVFAGEEKEISVPKSQNLPYAFAYSAAWQGGDKSDNLQMIVPKGKFRYYQDEDFPTEADARLVTFGKFAITNGAARISLGNERDTIKPQSATSGVGNKIVELAMQLRGKPYVWGGSSPANGFDCSGLTYYVLGQLGISIERTADLQYHRQESIGFKDLLPGDLVFFAWKGGEAEHVGIYIGNGKYIDAQNTVGAGPGATGEVMISAFDNWNKKYFIGGRRFR
ncbi:C40 family peptidase [Anaeroarcus burkinensis]|uniref:C40 family peptidase n=1 Tax=Anaeroarcus burkinensis TaxID=82376 RepID=UPI000422DA4E|nr:C40 family peptidase [Anaeroarcus burkinensis]